MEELTFSQKFKRSALHPLLFGCLTGLVAGGILTLFFLCAKIVLSVSADLYAYIAKPNALTWLYIPAVFAVLTLCALAASVLQKLVPTCRGSGIPLAEGTARGIFRPKWLETLAALFAGSLISFACGLPMGGEGPSIGIGGMTGEGIGRVFRLPTPYRRYLVTGGSAAALAVAFNAPLMGLAFAFEETHRRFTPQILIAAFSAVVCANLVSRLTLGNFTIFPHLIYGNIPLSLLPVCALVGLVCGIAGVAFNHAVRAFSKLFKRIPNGFLRLLPSFLLAGVFGLLLPVSVGSGDFMLETLNLGVSFWILLALFAIRFFSVTLASGAGTTGGLFLPLLSLGGILGFFAAKVLVLCGVPAETAASFVILSIACVFASSVRASITAIVLVAELTGSISSLLPAVLAVAVATVLADLVKCRPLYEGMLDRMSAEDRLRRNVSEFRAAGTVLPASIVCNKQIRNVLWPYNCLVVSVLRNGEAIFPEGETVLRAGDRILVKCQCESLALLRGQLREMIRLDIPENHPPDIPGFPPPDRSEKEEQTHE